MARAGGLLVLSLLCLLLHTGRAADTHPIELVELAFYEGASDEEPPEWDSIELHETFDRTRVRYIYTLINLKNNRWQQNDQDVRLHVRYYSPDGQLFGAPVIDYQVPADWEYADLWTGWGWDTADQWDPGFYRVEIWHDDRVKLGEDYFHITAGAEPVARPQAGNVALDRMGFFEAGDREDPPEDWSDSRVRDRFARSEARFIHTMVILKNLKWQVGDQEVVIHLRYYDSRGKVVGDPVIEYRIPQDWEYAELWNGWGWREAGNWKRDRYRVELWLDNRRKIGESHFEIY